MRNIIMPAVLLAALMSCSESHVEVDPQQSLGGGRRVEYCIDEDEDSAAVASPEPRASRDVPSRFDLSRQPGYITDHSYLFFDVFTCNTFGGRSAHDFHEDPDHCIYYASADAESIESYKRRLYRGTKYEAACPDMLDVVMAARWGDRDAWLLLSRVCFDAYVQAQRITPDRIIGFNPGEGKIILKQVDPEGGDPAYFVMRIGYVNHVPLAKILLDGYLRTISDDNICLFNVYDDTNGMKWLGKIYDATFREIEKLPEIDEN